MPTPFRLLRAALVATPMLVAQTARAGECAEPGRHCLDLGVRTGLGFGFGSITEGETLSDRTGGLLALGLDAGYRLASFLTVGVDATYSRVFLAKSSLAGAAVTGDGPCFEGTSCSATLVRLGLDVRFHLAPTSLLDPWIGVGAGYEILTVSENGHTTSPEGPITFDAVSVSLRGFEYGRLELGAAAHVSSAFTLGPFVALSLARYGSSRASGSISVGTDTVRLDTQTSREIVTTSFHEWLLLGVRGTYELPLLPSQ